MIIFDLDGTLADCEHRRHFITDPLDVCNDCYAAIKIGGMEENYQCQTCKRYPAQWKGADWRSFYEACDKDKPIHPVIETFLSCYTRDVEIWTGRCESVRAQTCDWICKYIYNTDQVNPNNMLKMRPIGDSTPDDLLKEKWLDEALAEGKKIDFVFDDRPKVVRMWRERGIFVFDVNQLGKEF
ncbi:MAG: phosphatase domain-containing protein [Rhodanobacter sp.]